MVALLLAVSVAQAQPPSSALQAKSPDAALIVRMAARGPVRILVHYRLPPSSGGATDDETIRTNRTVQDAILVDHFGPPETLAGPERALRRMVATPVFAINASAAEIEGLAQDGRVLQIVLDQARRPAPAKAR